MNTLKLLNMALNHMCPFIYLTKKGNGNLKQYNKAVRGQLSPTI